MSTTPEPETVTLPRHTIWPFVGFLIVACDLLGLYLYLGNRDYLLSPVWIYLFLYAFCFGFYVYAAARLVPKIPPRWSRATLICILLFSVLFRVAVVHAPPSLSSDMYRYVWDGRLTNHGYNPYRWAPNALTLRSFRDGLWDEMEYKAYQTIYMPVSQLIFAVNFRLFGSNMIGAKIVYLLFDLGVMGLIVVLLRGMGHDVKQIIWYAWCPLPITEISLAGHQDIVGVFFLLLAYVLAQQRRPVWLIAVTLVAAALTKGFALLLIPLFARTYGWRFTLAVSLALIYLGMPMWVCLPQFLHGMRQYLTTVHVNSGLFYALDSLLRIVTRYHFDIMFKLSDVAIVGITLWSARRPASSFLDLVRRGFIVLAVTLLVVPTLFPWYLVWTLPFMALIGQKPSRAFILLSGLCVLLYTFYILMLPLWWIPVIEYVPFYGVLYWEWRTWRRPQTGLLTRYSLGPTSTTDPQPT